MGKRKKKTPAEIWCPYCGRKAMFRPASYVYGDDSIRPETFLYVCSGYPKTCDAYVGAHDHNLQPKGTMADSELRHTRIMAHRALDAIWKQGYMTRNETYAWMATKLNLRFKEMHIGFFSDYLCQECIKICEDYIKQQEQLNKKRGERIKRMSMAPGGKEERYAT